jgi:hypothetical protein
MSKQDRQGVRTPAQLEQKYNFGGESSANQQSFAKLSRQVESLSSMLTQFIGSTNAALTEIRADIDKGFKKFHPEAFVFSITNFLTECVTTNDAVEITGGESYSTTIVAEAIAIGHVIKSLVVLMGGEDITDTACVFVDNATATINITSVTGDIVITAEGGEA